ncbi:hypothetical protein [Saccharothrix variisporea]|uniref:Uncharacterized protein n=1 Tax=Saccharothrix variisporea TaxID=543527 RepID=A0A495XGH3_9PSEU|nr:hypothetical protein [Saccharothrix variisporea]RKT71904.1 hypothetical protein DFJ66_5206 [Saccharothrix variisporea]
MAVSDAARRSGSLLLRALAVGGFAVTAWLLSGGVAAADDQDHPDVVSNPLDAVNLAVDQQQTATELLDVLAARSPVDLPPHVVVPAHALTAPALLTPPDALSVPTLPVDMTPGDEPDEDVPVYYQDEDTRDVEYSHTGGTHSATAPRTIANALPPEQYEAKVAAKAAARLAAQAPPAEPEPAAPPAAVHQDAAPAQAVPRQPAAEPDGTTPTWENPQPFTPTPAPQQAPAPTAPTSASASGHDGSQGHRGGVISSYTGQDRFAPPTLWQVEQRDDRRAPGSVPGLPSTSPD